jgi:hypothetical protein
MKKAWGIHRCRLRDIGYPYGWGGHGYMKNRFSVHLLLKDPENRKKYKKKKSEF